MATVAIGRGSELRRRSRRLPRGIPRAQHALRQDRPRGNSAGLLRRLEGADPVNSANTGRLDYNMYNLVLNLI